MGRCFDLGLLALADDNLNSRRICMFFTHTLIE